MAPLTIAVVTLGSLAVAIAAGLFGRRQRRGGPGGVASTPKLIWLGLVVALWFVIAPALALDPNTSRWTGRVLGVVAVSMWLRAPVELTMLYWLDNWRPVHGIGHDLATIVAALVVAGWPPFGPGEDLLLAAVILASLALETIWALTFLRLRIPTTGDDRRWFASDSPEFSAVNRATAIAQLVLIPALLISLISRAWPGS